MQQKTTAETQARRWIWLEMATLLVAIPASTAAGSGPVKKDEHVHVRIVHVLHMHMHMGGASGCPRGCGHERSDEHKLQARRGRAGLRASSSKRRSSARRLHQMARAELKARSWARRMKVSLSAQ